MVTSAIKKNSAEKGNEAGEQVAFFSFFFWSYHMACGTSPTRDGNPYPLQCKQSLNNWNTKDVPNHYFK